MTFEQAARAWHKVESLLRNRTKELVIDVAHGPSLSQSLQRSLDLSRSRGIAL